MNEIITRLLAHELSHTFTPSDHEDGDPNDMDFHIAIANQILQEIRGYGSNGIEPTYSIADLSTMTNAQQVAYVSGLNYSDIYTHPGDRNSDLLHTDRCFVAGTSIRLWDGTTKAIEAIKPADLVMTFDGEGNAVPGTVDKLFTNSTPEFITLSFSDERETLTVTPGHRFLTETGDYMEIGHMLRLGGGTARVVDVDGSIVEAQGEVIAYSAETAHLFAEAQSKTITMQGNTVLKEQVETGWQTYNFEVREHHNYVAGNIRVHNDSILSHLEAGDVLQGLSDDLRDAVVLRDIDGDGHSEVIFLDGRAGTGGDTELIGTYVIYSVDIPSIPGLPIFDLVAYLSTQIELNPTLATNPALLALLLDTLPGLDTTSGTFDADGLTEGASVIEGTSANNNIVGTADADVIHGLEGNDTLNGYIGDDTVYGGAGDDRILGGTGEDFLYGGDGNDTIDGEGGFDWVQGDAGDDSLIGGNQADNLWGGADNDILLGFAGLDRLFGGTGNDTLNGGLGNDALYGDEGDDRIIGGAGDDNVTGGAGFDTIFGGAGNVTLAGGFNADVFVFDGVFGADTITDFDVANAFEYINLSAVASITDFADLNSNHMSQVGGNTVIDDGSGNTITLTGVNMNDLTANEFIF